MDVFIATALSGLAGSALAAGLGRLREYRKEPAALADLLGYAFLVEPRSILLKDGGLLTGWRYRGPDLASSTEGELSQLSSHLSEALLPYGDGWMFHWELLRRPAGGYPPAGAFPDPITALIDHERRLAQESSKAYESVSYLVATYLPPQEVYARLAALFVQGRPVESSHWRTVVETFEAQAQELERRLTGSLKIARLGSDELLTLLHTCLTGLYHPVRTPPEGAFLDALLASQDLQGGFSPWIGRRALRVVAVHGYPHQSFAGILDVLGQLPYPLRVSHRLLFLGQARAAKAIEQATLTWFKKRQGARAWMRGALSEGAAPSAARERDDEIFHNADAVSMARDAAEAAAENASGQVRYAYYTPLVVLSDPEPQKADQMAAEVAKVLGDRGFPARLERLNAVDAFLGSLPGHGTPNLRRPLFGSNVVTDLLPVTAVWPGLPANPSPYFPPGSPPLFSAAAVGSTPFWFNLHSLDDVGHTLVVGQTGAGKSTLVNFLVAQFFRYIGAQAFVFDFGLSGWLLCRAAGGRHYHFGGDANATRLQPLREIDSPTDRAVAADWIETVLGLNGLSLGPPQRQAIATALSLLSAEEPQHRSLTTFLFLLQDRELAAALQPYSEKGNLGFLLDSDTDRIEATAYHVYELRSLAEMGNRALLPVLLHLFNRVERHLDQGRPTLIVIEEAWLALATPAFAGRLRSWLLTLRKRNAAVVLVTQSLSQLAASESRSIILESAPTRVLLPNPDAETPSLSRLYSEDLGLNSTEIRLLATARRRRDYYCKTPVGSRLFELGLGPIALAFLGTPEGLTPSEAMAEAELLIERHGADWPRAWLRQRGLEAALPLLDRLAGGSDA